ncbi:MAG TPA: hypothetical protein VFL83_15210 [Anaeromyxobacter sp.]|nr:hypothetical protein [Anaeromyxobacter sp.]
MRSTPFAAALCLSLAACGSGGDDAPSGNHVVLIQNLGSRTVLCLEREFTRLTLSQAGGAPQEHGFVSRPDTTIRVPVTLPATGAYDLRIYTASGSSIWWSGLAMDVDGRTTVLLVTDVMDLYENSLAAGLYPTGSDVPCT